MLNRYIISVALTVSLFFEPTAHGLFGVEWNIDAPSSDRSTAKWAIGLYVSEGRKMLPIPADKVHRVAFTMRSNDFALDVTGDRDGSLLPAEAPPGAISPYEFSELELVTHPAEVEMASGALKTWASMATQLVAALQKACESGSEALPQPGLPPHSPSSPTGGSPAASATPKPTPPRPHYPCHIPAALVAKELESSAPEMTVVLPPRHQGKQYMFYVKNAAALHTASSTVVQYTVGLRLLAFQDLGILNVLYPSQDASGKLTLIGNVMGSRGAPVFSSLSSRADAFLRLLCLSVGVNAELKAADPPRHGGGERNIYFSFPKVPLGDIWLQLSVKDREIIKAIASSGTNYRKACWLRWYPSSWRLPETENVFLKDFVPNFEAFLKGPDAFRQPSADTHHAIRLDHTAESDEVQGPLIPTEIRRGRTRSYFALRRVGAELIIDNLSEAVALLKDLTKPLGVRVESESDSSQPL